MKLKCVVACLDGACLPVLFPCEVAEDGNIEEKAREEARAKGYEVADTAVVFDDSAGPNWVIKHFWPDYENPCWCESCQEDNKVRIGKVWSCMKCTLEIKK